MRTGLRLGGAISLFVGILLTVLAVVSLFTAGRTGKFAAIGLGGGGIVCLGAGALIWTISGSAGSTLFDQNQILSTGQPGTAIIKAIRDTGITLQFGMYAVFEFDLEVDTETEAPYLVTCKSTVPRIALSMVGIEKKVAVRVDPLDRSHVAINWSSVSK